MREVDCGRKGIFSLLTARRLEFPQKETLTLTLYSTGWWGSTSEHHTQGKLAGYLSFGHSGGVNKESERERNKSLILDLLKSVTVLQSSRIWKTVIHHCLGPVDSWLWPWAINSITDVLQQLRLNNYTEEEGTFSTPPGSLMRCYKYGWRMIWTLQKLIICRVKSGVWAVIVIEPERQLGWLPCRAVTLNPSAVLNEYVHGCKKKTHTHTHEWRLWQCQEYDNARDGFVMLTRVWAEALHLWLITVSHVKTGDIHVCEQHGRVRKEMHMKRKLH